jgi:hypothetical protein
MLRNWRLSSQNLPAGTEARLAGLTELSATAIANAEAPAELRGFAEEQAALRRVATLVAGPRWPLAAAHDSGIKDCAIAIQDPEVDQFGSN